MIHNSWDSELTQPQLRPHSERRSERVSELGRPEPRECAKDKRRASYLAASGFSSRIPLSPSLSPCAEILVGRCLVESTGKYIARPLSAVVGTRQKGGVSYELHLLHFHRLIDTL